MYHLLNRFVTPKDIIIKAALRYISPLFSHSFYNLLYLVS